MELVFDGTGTQWVPGLEDPENDYRELYRAVRHGVAGCDCWAGAFGVGDVVVTF